MGRDNQSLTFARPITSTLSPCLKLCVQSSISLLYCIPDPFFEATLNYSGKEPQHKQNTTDKSLTLNLKFNVNVNICSYSHFYSYYLALFFIPNSTLKQKQKEPLVNLIQTKGEIASGNVSHLYFGGMQVKARHGKHKGQFTYICPSKPVPNTCLCFTLKVVFQFKFLLALTKKTLTFSSKAIFLLLDMIIIIQSIEKERGGNILTFQFSSKELNAIIFHLPPYAWLHSPYATSV